MKNIITAIALLICLNTFGQSNVKTYSGEMKTPKDILGKLIKNISKGQGAYSYYELEDGTRVKHGKFQFKYRYNTPYTVVGQYKNGKKEGVWVMTEYGYNQKERDKFTVTYMDDKLNGAYNGVLFHTHGQMKCSGEMKDNHYIGAVKIETPHSAGVIKGIFNEDGWAHGIWQVERKKGVPLTQEREYYQGFLLKVVETDLASGEKTILFEMPADKVADIKKTFNKSDSTIYIGGERYKRIQNTRPYDDIDSRLFPHTSGGKAVAEIFSETYDPTMREFIPLVNGFADMKNDYKWLEARREQERRAFEAEQAEKRRIEAEKKAEEQRVKEAKLEAEKQLIQERADMVNKVAEKHKEIDNKYYAGLKKAKIYDAYTSVLNKMDKADLLSVREIYDIQSIVLDLVNRKTKYVEKALRDKKDVSEIATFFKTEALALCK